MSQFLDDLHVVLTDPQANDGTGQWQLTRPIRYESNLLKQIVEVPLGFSTDFASVPRQSIIAWGLFGGRAIRPAVVHDYLVRYRRFAREKCDLVFLEAMHVDGVPEAKAHLMYSAVALFTASGLWKKEYDQPGYEPVV
jgi:hypothetical protein